MRTLLITTVIVLLSARVFADGLNALIEVGRSQADIARAASRETENFKKVKRAVESGAIEKGVAKERISRAYGEPVIAYEKGGRIVWVYKGAGDSFFEGVKVYLIFDMEGALEEARIAERKKKEDTE